VGPYIVDFYCAASRIAVELDGGQHFTAKGQAYDERRTAYLADHGVLVLRISNRDLFKELESTLEVLRRACVAHRWKVLHPECVGVAASDLVNVLTQALSGRPEILDAYLFGSQARGAARADSDVDVAIYLDPATDMNAGFGVDAAITTDLMRALGRNDVDVVLLNRADPVLYHRVLRDGVRLLMRDSRATAGRESYALSRYFDFLPQLEKIRRAADARTGDGHFGR
jgi:predicted nucleotidyltransferase